MGGSGTAQLSTVPHCACTNQFWPSSALLQLVLEQALQPGLKATEGTSVSRWGCTLTKGMGGGGVQAGRCAPSSGSCVGLSVGRGRSRRAAPLEWRDVPPAGLSGRSRSCPNRSPWQPAQASELLGWVSSVGCRGAAALLRCVHCEWHHPVPGHGTPRRDAAPPSASLFLSTTAREAMA